MPRTADEFERWIVYLVEHRGACSEPPPASTELPLALPRPPRSEDAEGVPPTWTIASAILTFCALVGGVIAYPWLAGTAIALIVVAVIFRRRLWRWPTSPLAVLVFVIVGGVIGELAATAVDSHPGSSARPRFASPPEAGQIVGEQMLSATGTLNLGGYVRLRGTEAWRSEIHGVPGDTIQWELYVSDDNASKTFTNVTVNDVLPQYVTLIPRSLRFVSGNRGDEILASGPLFGGGYNAGSYIPNDSTLYVFEGVLDPGFPGCAIRLENYGGIGADGIARAPHESATLVDVERSTALRRADQLSACT